MCVGAVPKGSPPERFNHSPFEYNGYVFTDNESPVIKPGYTQASRRDALTGHPLRYRSQAMRITQSQIVKKYTANGHVRRGRPLTSQTAFGGHTRLPYKGSLVWPAVRFDHSPFGFDGMFFDYE